MRRALLAIGALVGAGSACFAFAFPRPGDTAGGGDDAGSDVLDAASAEGGADDGGEAAAPASLLSVDLAARFCTQLFVCARLPEAVELSIAWPFNTPSVPLNFSACMDWAAGPVDPARPGLDQQQTILGNVAKALSCNDAFVALPVQTVKADGGCVDGCQATSQLTVCGPGGASFETSCSSAWFAPGVTGDCIASDAGNALCVSLGACSPAAGKSCPDPSTLRECYPGGASYTSYDCALTGRQCASGGPKVAECVVPGKLAPPCVLDDVRDECDGDSVKHCAGGAVPQTEIACAPVGATCAIKNDAGAARCVRTGDDCTPFDADQNVCSGQTISVCIAGKRQTVDCSSFGAMCHGGGTTATGHCG